jgi:lysophospholipase L1-like esterase
VLRLKIHLSAKPKAIFCLCRVRYNGDTEPADGSIFVICSKNQQAVGVEELRQVNKRQAGTFSRRKWVEYSKKPGRKIWRTFLKTRALFWSFLLRLSLFFLGIYFIKSAVIDERGNGLSSGRILTFTVGVALSILCIVISLPWIGKGRFHKLETVSRYLLQASFWCFVSWFVVELILRSMIQNPPFRRDVTNWAGDLPAVHSFVLWGKEGYGITQYEKWGEIQTPYHDNKKNNDVIVFGDSQTECLQVNDDQKFVSVAETVIRSDGYDADLHNLGRSGLAMGDYISWIPPYRAIYRPRVIVLQLTTSDFTESFRKDMFNYFVLQDDGEMELVHTYDLSSGFIQRAREGHYLPSQVEDLGLQRWQFLQGAIENVPDGNAILVGTESEAFDPGLADQQMKMLIDASGGVPLIVVLLPTAPNISDGKIQMSDSTHEQLKEFIKRYPGITIVDPLPEFQKLASMGYMPRGFFNSTAGVGHLNKYGNEIVGRLLAKSVEQVMK